MEPELIRRRILDLIEPLPGTSVRLIEAESGSGKTAALRARAKSENTIFLAVSERATFARFASDFVQAFRGHTPGLQQTLAGAFERALQTADAPATLALWLGEHLDGEPCTVIIDDLQRASDARITRFVTEAIERSPATCGWIIASESLAELPVGDWLVRGLTGAPVTGSQFAFTFEEALQAARRLKPNVEDHAVRTLHAQTSGVPADFIFALGVPAVLLEIGDGRDRFLGLASRIFDTFSPADRRGLFQVALAGQASPFAEALRAKAPYVFKPGQLRLQTTFARFVRAQLDASPEKAHVIDAAALALEDAGEIANALELLMSIGAEEKILAVIDRHGFAFLENHNAFALYDAIAHLGDETKSESPAVLTLLATSSSLIDRFDIAEAYFKTALRISSGQLQRQRVGFWYGCDLLRRGRPGAVELLEAAHDETEDGDLRIVRQSALAAAYAVAGRSADAGDAIALAVGAAEQIVDQALTARVYHQAAYVALRAGRYEDAKEMATRALALAERAGAYESAGGALSVLYNVAIDVDEDYEAAAALLRRIAECGAKCGSVDKQLYALAAAYEIETERGDRPAVADIELKLQGFEIRFGSRSTIDALLPARALQLAWLGDFSRARAILRGSADLQLDPGRRALRQAEIAVYAAASGSNDEASSAIVKAHRQMRLAPKKNVHVSRARAYVALAFTLLGRKAAAQSELASLAELPSGSQRVTMLTEFVRELAALQIGTANAGELLAILDRVRASGLGGFARLLEALPGDLLTPEGGHPRKALTA